MCLRLRIIKFYDAIKCRRNRLPCDALVSCDKSNVKHMFRFRNQTGESGGVNSSSIVIDLLQLHFVFFDTFGLVIEISSFSVSVVLLFILAMIICLCCHP